MRRVMDTNADELPRVLELLWGRDQSGRRGPKPGLTIRDIGAAGVRIADAEGLAAVSMSKVAADLGFTTMSLYRYVASKDDLLTVMLDEGFGVPELEEMPGAGWRDRMTAWARAAHATLLRHPWILQIPLFEPPLSPHQMAWMEAGLQALAETGLTHQERLSSMLLVDVYVRGMTQLTAYMHAANAETGRTEQEADQLYARRLALVLDPDRFPAVAAALRAGSLSDESDFAVDEFRFGLETVLDGIAALIARRTTR